MEVYRQHIGYDGKMPECVMQCLGGKESQSYSRFWGVHRGGGVTDVLGTLEHPERQTGQEISG